MEEDKKKETEVERLVRKFKNTEENSEKNAKNEKESVLMKWRENVGGEDVRKVKEFQK